MTPEESALVETLARSLGAREARALWFLAMWRSEPRVQRDPIRFLEGERDKLRNGRRSDWARELLAEFEGLLVPPCFDHEADTRPDYEGD